MTRFVVVTGTSTDVGKTIVTAALAVQAAASGASVVVVKPVQTGAGDGSPGDIDVVRGLTGCDVRQLVTLNEPLAPDTAARLAGVTIPVVAEHVASIRALAEQYDVVIVEGAGGLLVRLDTDGGTLLDLAASLDASADVEVGVGVEVVLVCAAGLGTLNHSELTVLALRARGLEPTGLVIGSWPTHPDLAQTCNRTDLPRVTGVPLLAAIPAGALTPSDFVAGARGWFAPSR